MDGFPLLSLLLALPLAGAVAALFFPPDRVGALKSWALGVTLGEAFLVFLTLLSFRPGRPGFQMEELYSWIGALGISFHLGVDGISMALLGLTGLIFVVAAVASWSPIIGEHRVKEYTVFLLILEAAAVGVFTSLDYVLFFLFWEAALIPTYFLILIWGGARREYAATKFLVFTMVGSLVMLVGIVALWLKTGASTFSMEELAVRAGSLPEEWKRWIFLAFALGFAVKVPLWPLHTWLPDAHGQAPTPVSVILAAILLKMGAYGFFRVLLPTFPEVAREFAPAIALLGVVNIVYGAFATMAQIRDFKRFVAYSSISHMGFVMLGIAAGTSLSLGGAVFESVSHGLIAGMLFLLAGLWYDRTHTLDVTRLGGMNAATPVAATLLTFAAMANLGLPGLSGFIAEFSVLLGTVDVFRSLVYAALVGLVVVAAFNLLLLHRVVMGEPREEFASLPDADRRELASLLPLVAATVLLGIFPSLLTRLFNGPVLDLAARVGGIN